MSDMSKSLHQDLAEVMGAVGYIQKDGKNQAQSYKYASAEAVLKKVNAELSARGIAIESKAVLENFNVTHYATTGKTRTGDEFTKQNFRSDAVVRLCLTFVRGDESVQVEGIGASTDLGDKAVMKANTAAIKYCLTNAFLISWGDDPEASAAGDAPSAPKPAAKKKGAAKKAESTTKTTGLKKAEKF